jgi:type I restriction enzyme R subunit
MEDKAVDLEFLSARYASEGLTENEMKKIISKLELIPSAPLYDGNRNDS